MKQISRAAGFPDRAAVLRLGMKASSSARRKSALRALTTDLWYTVVYLRPKDQRELARIREETWMAPLLRSGWSRARARLAVRHMDVWATDRESRGRTPTIFEQAAWLGRSTGVPISGSDAANALDGIVVNSPVRLAPGVGGALGSLRDHGIRLGLVSNLLHETGAGARQILSAFGILDDYSVLVFSDEHPWSKPRPEPFQYALSELGVPPNQAVHVGDLAYDVMGCRRAGMSPILYTGLHRWEPARLKDLSNVDDPSVVRLGRWGDVAARVLRGF